MSKVIMFARQFPAYHPKAGQPTYFIEKILNSLNNTDVRPAYSSLVSVKDMVIIGEKKHHTIRSGHRFKVGDKFSPRVWSGKPYRSKQIVIAPDIEVKKVWDFQILEYGAGYHSIAINGIVVDFDILQIATNDGLTKNDFSDWLKIGHGEDFDGQIICWNESINY